MPFSRFEWSVLAVASAFTVFFFVVVAPPAISSGDLAGAIGDGFVNPSASGYSTDVILCWVVLAIWIVHDARVRGVTGGWWCLLLGAIPGVVVGFAAYLVIRGRQLEASTTESAPAT